MVTFELITQWAQGRSANWQRLCSLIAREEAAVAKIPAEFVHWSDKESVKDGGFDVWIERGGSKAGQLFLPDAPCVWSVKSGEYATDSATFVKEFKPSRTLLRSRLREGAHYVYCVCTPINLRARQEFTKECLDAYSAQGFDPARLHLLFDNHIEEAVNAYPFVLEGIPGSDAPPPGMTLDQWANDVAHFESTTAFADIGARGLLIESLALHLRGNEQACVRHLAGLSGVGKTRVAYEACRHHMMNRAVRYFPTHGSATKMLDFLYLHNRCHAAIVIDECSLEDHFDIAKRFASRADRVRILTIGPARGSETSRDSITILDKPESTIDVLRINNAVGIDDALLKLISDESDHDIRFALLILKVIRADLSIAGNWQTLVAALRSTDDLFERVLRLHRPHEWSPDFKSNYKWLTIAGSIGMSGDASIEVDYVAQISEIPKTRLLECAHSAVVCGLGVQPSHLFEAVPRGIATQIFVHQLWPIIKQRGSSIFKSVPTEELRKSILRRAEVCPTSVRKEVVAYIDTCFREEFGGPSLAQLRDPLMAKRFRDWAELSPETGLSWLRVAIDAASIEELRAFRDFDQGPFAVSGPRREIVWLLDHLACFAESFELCEEMLFRLALTENETFANNATAKWTQRFRVFFSNAQTPFDERLDLLTRRLTAATLESIDLVMKAVHQAVHPPDSVAAPPPVIGGRLVPKEWRPTSSVYQHCLAAVSRCTRAIDALPQPVKQRAIELLIRELWRYTKEGSIAILRDLIGVPTARETHLALLKALSDAKEYYERATSDQPDAARPGLDAIDDWIRAVTPTDPVTQLQAIVSRPPWDYHPLEDQGAWKPHYVRAARIAREYPSVFSAQRAWFTAQDGNSLWSFGSTLASEGSDGCFDVYIEDWLRTGTAIYCVIGYLIESGRAAGQLPHRFVTLLNELVPTSPRIVGDVTARCDPTYEGWLRLLQCFEVQPESPPHFLGQVFSEEWRRVLGWSGLAKALELLWPEVGERSSANGAIALHLLGMWLHADKTPELPSDTLAVVKRLVLDPPHTKDAMVSYHWQSAAERIASLFPIELLEACLSRALDWRHTTPFPKSSAIEIIKNLASTHQDEAARILYNTLDSVDAGSFSSLEKWHQVLTAIGSQALAKASQNRPLKGVRLLGQCVPDPAVTEDGRPDLPDVTAWYLSTFGDDPECFTQFQIGRWNGRVTSGWAWNRTDQVHKLANAYAQHPISALRKWSDSLLKEHAAELKHDRAEYEDERRF